MLLYPRAPLLASTTALLAVSACTPARSQVAGPSVSASAPGRGEREARAPQVMASPAAPGSQSGSSLGRVAALDEAAEMGVFVEAQKRLSKLEKSDPAQALAEYKKFWQGRAPHPAVAVQVALKIVELRLSMKDVPGALVTCDVLEKKYATDPASAQLALQKAQILVSQKRFDEATSVVDEALPKLLSLRPESYLRTSEVLLSMAQMCAELGGEAGKQRASGLYEGVEQVYLRWLKGGTLPYTWQMLAGLQKKYAQVGEKKRAADLLPKAAEVLLAMAPTKENPEGADASVTAARWLEGNGHEEDAHKLYDKAPFYGNAFVTEVAMLDKVKLLAKQGKVDEALRLANPVLSSGVVTATKVRMLAAVGYGYYKIGNFGLATRYSSQVLADAKSVAPEEAEVSVASAKDVLLWSERWAKAPIACEPRVLNVGSEDDARGTGFVVKRLHLSSHRVIPLKAKCDEPGIEVQIDGSGSTNDYAASRDTAVLIPPALLSKDRKATIVITSPEFPDFQLTILLHVDASAPA